MDLHTRSVQSRIPLLPDADLLQMIDEMRASPPKRSNDREEQTRSARQMAAIRRELKARGMSHPPWWSANRNWEIEELSGRVLNGTRMLPANT